ncbi:hypothetical protein [Paenibacillus sp. Mc5Re-14]|uniref:hypothetical protein n=1 Tax=Paenibacillus sp. Mc5Re-14 TaxID=1030529 RepID=UPI000AADE4BE|nr:hypothetical protein [Paenibacillus sp. Mc5Re-14]
MAEKQIVKDFEMNKMRVEVKIVYDLGGMNYFTSNVDARGYYVHVQPYTVEKHDGYSMRKMLGFSGVKMLLLEVNRKSAKKLQEAVNMVSDEMIDTMVKQCKFE